MSLLVVPADEGDFEPPPASQSHFAKFENFTPDDNASFDDEFARLASSQRWVSGSQEYIRQRTIAIKEELDLHYFSQQPQDESEDGEEAEEEEGTPRPEERKPGSTRASRSTQQLTNEELERKGYQDLCREVGIEPSESIAECKRLLKSKLVNIIDLIDARRNGKVVEVWDDFDAFRDYTLDDEKRIDKEEAKGTHLESLLQRLIIGPRSRRKRRANKRRGRGRGVVSGRITKQRAP
jgi:hypothetical protein